MATTIVKATPAKTKPAPAPTWTTDLWAAQALHNAGLPVNATNIANLKSWMTAETGGNLYPSGAAGNWARDNNPLNMQQYGSTPPPDQNHYWQFSSLDASAQAFAGFMKQSNMAGIRAALASSAPLPIFSAAVTGSPWGTSSQSLNASTTPIGANPTTKSASPGVIGQFFGATGLPGGGVAGDIASATGLTDLTGAAGSTANALGSIGTLAGDLINPSFWKRVGVFFFGTVLIGTGLVIFISTTQTGKKITSEGTQAAMFAATKGAV